MSTLDKGRFPLLVIATVYCTGWFPASHRTSLEGGGRWFPLNPLSRAKSILIQSMAGARKERDEEGRFFDDWEIFNALKATDAYGRAFAGRSLS